METMYTVYIVHKNHNQKGRFAMKKIQNKWINAAIPALLIHSSIGSVYCWSLFKGNIADYIGRSDSQIEWAFSIAIFVLGMSAAFSGKFVEEDIHKSSLVAAICFAVGMAGTGISIYMKSLLGIYFFYGLVMGIGLGVGYLSPVKTLMLWFEDQKGLATGLAVAGFGLAKVLASPVIELIQGPVNADGILINPSRTYIVFFILAGIYFVMMFAGHLLLKKPEGWVEEGSDENSTGFATVFKNKTFVGIWLMFYINIACGLALISQEKDIMLFLGFGSVAMVSSLTAVFNAGGRLFFSALGDKLKDRNTIYKVIFLLAIGFTGAIILTDGINKGMVSLVIILLCVVNAGYGGGFSNLPTLLSDRFGMESISTVHGLALSAWAVAGLTGNQLSAFIIAKTGSYNDVLIATLVLYIVAMIVSYALVKPGKNEL